MSFFSNPIVICGLVALAIVFILIIVVVICCKKSEAKEREELLALSDEIDENDIECDMIEDVLCKMQESLEAKEDITVTFEQEQEENAIISYKELLDALGTSNFADDIDVYEDELESQIVVSDCNKEIIDSYQNEGLQREFYAFQNDYSNQEMPMAMGVNEDVPIMDLKVSEENTECVEDEKSEYVSLKNNVVSKKFKRTEIISPVYGIVNNRVESVDAFIKNDAVEEIVFDDDSLIIEDIDC